MNHSDFAVGTIFYTCTGQRWRCTDLGTRTILAIELKPDLAEAYYGRGNVKDHQGDLAGALADYIMALKLSPNNSLMQKNLDALKSRMSK